MKKCVTILFIGFSTMLMKPIPVSAQSDEVQQLLLNVEKLTQFKKILKNMKDGYQIIHRGYTTIKDISVGNFSQHKTFLDALLQVSPAVRKYKRIADIVSYQIKIVKQYRSAFNQFREDGSFTPVEIQYIGIVYGNLFDASLKNLDELSIVITAGKLRMSDDERLQAIDRIYATIEDQYSFLEEFNNNTAVLSLQRKSEQAEIDLARRIRGF